MGNYVTAADVKKEGISASNDVINRRITKWEAIIEKLTGQVFRIISPGELEFDGNNSRYLHFNLPLVEVTQLRINGEDTAAAADEFRAYTGRSVPQDDRQNPKIELTPIRRNIYRAFPGIFVKGREQYITATWGYVEPDDSTPQPIIDVVTELVVLDIDSYFEKAGVAQPATSVRRERTDGHEIEYQQMEDAKAVWTMLPAHITEILSLYRSPLKIAAPEPIRWYYDTGIDYLEPWIVGI